MSRVVTHTGISTGFDPLSPSSSMTSTACLWSGARRIPSFAHWTFRFRITSSFGSPIRPEIICSRVSYRFLRLLLGFSMTLRGLAIKTSSPCIVPTSFPHSDLNTHFDIAPIFTPPPSRQLPTPSAMTWPPAASRRDTS